VPDAVAPPPHHPRFPLIDGVRALAVLSVLAVHAPGGQDLPDPLARIVGQLGIGVTFFFVISGFLLYRPFIAWRAGGATSPPVAAYARRRFLRIYPAYWLALTVLTVVPGFVGASDGGGAAQYALVQTLPILGGPVCFGFTDCDLAQTWSLVVELGFYLLLPLYVIAAARLTRRLNLSTWVTVELAALAALAALSLAARYFLAGQPATPWVGQTVLGDFAGFAVGMAFAVLSVAGPAGGSVARTISAGGRRPGAVWALAAAVYICLCLWLPRNVFAESNGQMLVANTIQIAVACLVVLPAVFEAQTAGWPRQVLAHPAVAWIGLVSYGVFLWHFAIGGEFSELPFVLAVPVVAALSIAVAALSYYLVERPILRLKNTSLHELLAAARLRTRGAG
jgi:peptidoglycan/LPS O-acetylase OafA/YrhL